MEAKCGRPLGLRQLDAETILAIDAHLGIFSINFKKGRNYICLYSLYSFTSIFIEFYSELVH